MALFKNTPQKALQREIEAAAANRDRLATKLAECNEAAARHAAAAKEAALSGDDAALDSAEGSLRAAQDRAATLKTAIAELDIRLADLERAKAEAADKKTRAETAAEIELMVTELNKAGAEFNEIAARFAKHTAAAVPVVFEALGLDRFMGTCLAEVPAALELVAKLLRAHSDQVIAGTAPATLPRPENEVTAQVPAVATPPAEPPFEYYPIRSGPRYRGHTGP